MELTLHGTDASRNRRSTAPGARRAPRAVLTALARAAPLQPLRQGSALTEPLTRSTALLAAPTRVRAGEPVEGNSLLTVAGVRHTAFFTSHGPQGPPAAPAALARASRSRAGDQPRAPLLFTSVNSFPRSPHDAYEVVRASRELPARCEVPDQPVEGKPWSWQHDSVTRCSFTS